MTDDHIKEAQTREEYVKEWFVYDTVPRNLKQKADILNRKRGIWGGPLTGLVIILIYFLLSAWIIPKEHFQIRYIFLLAVISEAFLTAAIRISVCLQKRKVEEQIQKYGEESLKGRFHVEHLQIEYRSGTQECYYYNDLSDAEETMETFLLTGPGRELKLDKRYLSREDILYIRNQLAHYCRIFQGYEEPPGTEKVELRIPCMEKSCRERRAQKNALLLSLKTTGGRGLSEWRMHILGAFMTSLLCMWIFLPVRFDGILKTVVIIIVLCWLFTKAGPYVIVSIKLRKKKGVEQTDIRIDENGAHFRQGKKEVRQEYKIIKEIREENSSFCVGRVYFWKDSMTAEEIGAVRHILIKYGRGKYKYVTAERESAWKEDLRSAIIPLALLVLGVFMILYRAWMIDTGKMSGLYQESGYGMYTGELNSGVSRSVAEPEGGTDDAGQNGDTLKTQGDKEPIYVFTPDQSSLHLSAKELRLDECYSDNTVNLESRFFIQNGNLFGISANRHGEMGLGNTEPDITAKGFYRTTELASNVKHVAQGNGFMVYLNNEDELWGAGNLPGTGQSLIPALIMKDVVIADCSETGLVILKKDGTVWCMGSLSDSAGNQIVSWDGAVQVLDHTKYVTAGRYAMAAIQEDDTLWMWGDNRTGQCGGTETGVSVITRPEKIRDGVKTVWIDRLAYRDYEEYPLYGMVQTREYMDYCTYIQQKDGKTYVCGSSTGAGGFVIMVVAEE